MTLDAFYAECSQRQLWESNTRTSMCLSLRSTRFGDLPLAKLRRSHVEGWVKPMDEADLAPGTIKTRVNNVRAILRGAVRDRIIAVDPSDGVTLPRDRRREAAMVLRAAEQMGAIMAAADPAFRAFVALGAFAGPRLGEAAGLQVADFNFLRRSLDVRRQVQRAGAGKVEVRAPKYGSERTVYLADGLLDLLSAHIAEHRAGEDPSRWLFEASAGLPPHQNTVGHQWRKACKLAGLTLHDLRHFYASGLITAGCGVVTVQRALRHAKATTTLSTRTCGRARRIKPGRRPAGCSRLLRLFL